MKTFSRLFILVCFILSLYIVDSAVADYVFFEDGGYHIVNDTQYQDDVVFLDSNVINNPGTRLELIDGGSIREVTAKHNSLVTINGGLIGWRISLHDKSSAIINDGLLDGLGIWTGYESNLQISGGTITGDIESMGTAMVSIYGGVIEGDVEAWYECTTKIYGGTIGDWLEVFGNGKIYLYGSGFSVGSRYLNLGDSLRDYGTFNGNGVTGTIKGKLQDGSDLNNVFYISGLNTNCDIIVIPEPATMLLLGLDGLLIRRKK